jgi:hypothetical protein
MIERIGRAIADADGTNFSTDPERFRRMARAALAALATPTETMIGAAHEAVWFDAVWAINSRRDFQRAVKAMLAAPVAETDKSAK